MSSQCRQTVTDFSPSGGVHHLPGDAGEQRAVLVPGQVPGQDQRVRDQSQRADGDEVGWPRGFLIKSQLMYWVAPGSVRCISVKNLSGKNVS